MSVTYPGFTFAEAAMNQTSKATEGGADTTVVTFPFRDAVGNHVRCPFCYRAWGVCVRNPCDSMGRYDRECSSDKGADRG